MEQVYKGYFVLSGAAPSHGSDGFQPIAQVNWIEDGRERVRLWMEFGSVSSFATYNEAETAANLSAKNWIDDNAKVK